jgi:hypothetical protein
LDARKTVGKRIQLERKDRCKYLEVQTSGYLNNLGLTVAIGCGVKSKFNEKD